MVSKIYRSFLSLILRQGSPVVTIVKVVFGSLASIVKGSNSYVMVNVWNIARDPKAWEKPLEFDPDRFVENPVNLDGRDFRIIPFGAGRRMCPGYNLGLRMIQFALASFIHAFDWSLPCGQEPGDLDMSEKYEISIRRQVPLNLLATPRLPTHLYNSPISVLLFQRA